MLKRIKNIQFQLRSFNSSEEGFLRDHDSELRWMVSSQVPMSTVHKEEDDGLQFKQIESYTLNVTVTKLDSTPNTTEWMVVNAFLRKATLFPKELQEFVLEEGFVATRRSDVHSVPDVAIAAPVTGGKYTCHFYNSLPLEANCGLPVNVHGRFAITPDGRSLRTDSKEGEWNRFLAQSCLSKLYFIFLERLVISHRDIADFYAFWPSWSIKTQNKISDSLQAAFWAQISQCRRHLFLNPSKTPVPISQAIFDTRGSVVKGDSIQLLVKLARPSHAIVNSSAIRNGLLLVAERSLDSDFLYLTPKFVRNLLQEDSIRGVLKEVADSDLKSIVSFILENGSMEDLDGCYVLRLADDSVVKVKSIPKIGSPRCFYIIDNKGFNLFKDIEGSSLISPAVLDMEITNRLQLQPTFNVRKISGSVIDILVKSKVRTGRIRTFTESESVWLAGVYKYITSHKVLVEFYQKHPMLPLSNKPNTFISMEFLNDSSLLPPINGPSQRRITDKFPDLHILADRNFEPVKQLFTASSADRFLEYLFALRESGQDLEEIFRDKALVSDLDTEVQSQ